MITFDRTPLLFVVSAPSGAGKTTLCDRLLHAFSDITYSVSCTTRPPRVGERDGQHYHFMSPPEFQKRVAADAFLEHAEVHGHFYGTLKETVHTAMSRGYDVLMDIDVQGAMQVRQQLRADASLSVSYVDVFIAPPSVEDLQLRLWGRGKDDDSVIRRRLERATDEMLHWVDYQYVVLNDRLDESFDMLRSIVLAERQCTKRLRVKKT